MLRHRSFVRPSRHLAACCIPLVLFAATSCTDDPPLGPARRVAPSLTVGVPGSGAVVDEGVTFLLPPGTGQFSHVLGARDGAGGTTTVVGELSPFPAAGEFVQRTLPIRWRIAAAGGITTDTLQVPVEAIPTNGVAFDVNAEGQAAGAVERIFLDFSRASDAVVWEPTGELRRLPKGGAVNAQATVIADDGTVYGRVDGVVARWSPAGVLERLGDDPAWAAARVSDVNGAGQVVGVIDSGAAGLRAFRWDPASGFHFLRGLPRGRDTGAEGINESGLVVGSAMDWNGRSTAVLWHDDTTLTVIGHPFDATGSGATDVNDIGQVLGVVFWINADGGGRSQPFLWQPRTGRTPIGPDALTARMGVTAITERGVIARAPPPPRRSRRAR